MTNSKYMEYNKVKDYLNFDPEDYEGCWVVIVLDEEGWGWDIFKAFEDYRLAQELANCSDEYKIVRM